MSVRKPTESRPDDALDEVERALSVLGGRHPETERLRREEAEARAKKQAELAALVAEDRKIELRRRVGIAAGVTVAVVALGALAVFVKTSLARRATVERAVEPYRGMGFEVVATSSRASPRSVEGTVAPGCVLAIASDPAARLEVRRPSGTIKGPGPILFCICDSEAVTASAELAEGGGVALLRMDAAQIGGSRALSFAPGKAATTAKTDDVCAEASFDAWLDGKRFPKAAPDDAWFGADPRRKALAGAGFTSALAMATEPFAAVEIPKASCLVALPDGPGDPISLRARGVGVVGGPEDGPLGWCTQEETIATVHHDGRGRVGAFLDFLRDGWNVFGKLFRDPVRHFRLFRFGGVREIVLNLFGGLRFDGRRDRFRWLFRLGGFFGFGGLFRFRRGSYGRNNSRRGSWRIQLRRWAARSHRINASACGQQFNAHAGHMHQRFQRRGRVEFEAHFVQFLFGRGQVGAEALEVFHQHQRVLLLLEEPDRHEGRKVAVVPVVAQEHLGGRQGRPLGDGVHLDGLRLFVRQLGGVEAGPGNVLVHVPADGLELLEEFRVKHG